MGHFDQQKNMNLGMLLWRCLGLDKIRVSMLVTMSFSFQNIPSILHHFGSNKYLMNLVPDLLDNHIRHLIVFFSFIIFRHFTIADMIYNRNENEAVNGLFYFLSLQPKIV